MLKELLREVPSESLLSARRQAYLTLKPQGFFFYQEVPDCIYSAHSTEFHIHSGCFQSPRELKTITMNSSQCDGGNEVLIPFLQQPLQLFPEYRPSRMTYHHDTIQRPD